MYNQTLSPLYTDMTPVDQQFMKVPEIGQAGDCARAAIATLLDLPLIDVPHFLQEVLDGKTSEKGSLGFYGYIDDWLEDRGYIMQWQHNPIYHPVGTYCYISGPSPNIVGGWHACVGQIQEDRTIKLLHDPHPLKKGLLEPERWKFSFLVKHRRSVS
jgi:hypothetical protein